MYSLGLQDDPPAIGGSIPNLLDKISKEEYNSLYRKFYALPRIKFEEILKSKMPVPFTEYVPALFCEDEFGNLKTYEDPDGVKQCPAIYSRFIKRDFLPILRNDKSIIHYANMYEIFKRANTDAMIKFGITDSWEWEQEKLRRFYAAESEDELVGL